jgi:hypothetical protein
MHSRIFQLTEEPIDKDDYMTEWSFCEDSFVGAVADYVSDNCDREEDIKWLIKSLEDVKEYFTHNPKNQSITFHPGFKVEYFRERFKKFNELVSGTTLEVFANGSNAYELKSTIEDKYSFYVHHEYWEPFDSFVRSLPSDEDETCYFGGTVDYHY